MCVVSTGVPVRTLARYLSIAQWVSSPVNQSRSPCSPLCASGLQSLPFSHAKLESTQFGRPNPSSTHVLPPSDLARSVSPSFFVFQFSFLAVTAILLHLSSEGLACVFFSTHPTWALLSRLPLVEVCGLRSLHLGTWAKRTLPAAEQQQQSPIYYPCACLCLSNNSTLLPH